MVTVTISETLLGKLHPRNFTGMSGKWVAILGCILDQHFTNPQIVGLIITKSDGMLMGMHEGDCGYNEFLGTGKQLRDNWVRYLNTAQLTPAEREEAEAIYNNRVETV